jgi:hypothetical protein
VCLLLLPNASSHVTRHPSCAPPTT